MYFLANLHIDLEEIQYVITTCRFVEAHCNVCFRFVLDLMLNMTKLDCLILVRMTLMFTQGHRVMGKTKVVQ